MGQGKRRYRHSTKKNNNNKNTPSPPTTTTTTPPSRIRLLPRELRDKIYENICLAPNGHTFSKPSPSSILGLGRQMGAELTETFHREILARDDAEIMLPPRTTSTTTTRKYKISWSFDTSCGAEAGPCAQITLPVQLWREAPCLVVAPGIRGNGGGETSIWREPDKSGGGGGGGRACQKTNNTMPSANARMLFLDWLNQREKSIPEKRRKFLQALKDLVVDFNNGQGGGGIL